MQKKNELSAEENKKKTLSSCQAYLYLFVLQSFQNRLVFYMKCFMYHNGHCKHLRDRINCCTCRLINFAFSILSPEKSHSPFVESRSTLRTSIIHGRTFIAFYCSCLKGGWRKESCFFPSLLRLGNIKVFNYSFLSQARLSCAVIFFWNLSELFWFCWRKSP